MRSNDSSSDRGRGRRKKSCSSIDGCCECKSIGVFFNHLSEAYLGCADRIGLKSPSAAGVGRPKVAAGEDVAASNSEVMEGKDNMGATGVFSGELVGGTRRDFDLEGSG